MRFPLAATVLLVACHSAPPAAAPSATDPVRVRVHVDHVRADAVAEWEAARTQYLAWLAAAGVREQPTLVVEDEAAHTFYLLRPFPGWSGLDAASDAQARADERATTLAGADTFAHNEDRIHASLEPPHYNEIWRLDDAAALATLADAAAWQVESDEVLPPAGDAWDATVAAIDAALAQAGYPPRISISVSFGSGRVMSAFPAAASAHDALVQALGGDAAAALEAARGATTTDQRAFVVRVRRELSSWP